MIAKINEIQNELIKEMKMMSEPQPPVASVTFVPATKNDRERIPQEEYDQLVEPYREAMTRLEVRMKGLNEDYRKKYRDYPIHKSKPALKAERASKKNSPSATCPLLHLPQKIT